MTKLGLGYWRLMESHLRRCIHQLRSQRAASSGGTTDLSRFADDGCPNCGETEDETTAEEVALEERRRRIRIRIRELGG